MIDQHLENLSGPDLDPSQRESVALAMTEKISLLIGPPGTGKSTAISAMIQKIKADGKVLACAPSNTATDSLANALATDGLKVIVNLSTLNSPFSYCTLDHQNPFKSSAVEDKQGYAHL